MSKYAKLENALLKGQWINPMMALKKWSISPSAYHTKISKFKAAHPEYMVEGLRVKTGDSYYKKHRALKRAEMAA